MMGTKTSFKHIWQAIYLNVNSNNSTGKKSCDCRPNEMKFGLWVPWGPESSCLTWCKRDGPLSWVIRMEKWCSGFFTGEVWSEFPSRWAGMQRALHEEVPQWPRVLMLCVNPLGDASHTQQTVKSAFPAMKIKERNPEQIGMTGKGVSTLGKNQTCCSSLLLQGKPLRYKQGTDIFITVPSNHAQGI